MKQPFQHTTALMRKRPRTHMPFTRTIATAATTTTVIIIVLICLCTTAMVAATVPPKAGTRWAETYEDVHAYRQRLNIPYNYTPKLISPEMCRHLTEAECERHDVLMQQHASDHRAIQKKHYEQRRQRRLQQQQQQNEENLQDFQEQLGAFTNTYGVGKTPPTKEEELAELYQLLQEFNTTRTEFYDQQQQHRLRRQLQGANRESQTHNPSVGIFVVPLFLLRFSDHVDRPLPDQSEYQILWNLRIRKWIQENSYGRYEAWFDVQDWDTTEKSEAFYAAGESGRVASFQNAFIPLLNRMDERLNGDWSLYDANDDGVLDNVIALHSGYAAEESGNDCTNNRASPDRIWSHAFADAGFWVSPSGQYSLRGYMVSSALDLLCDSNPAKMGVMTHEYMHTFWLIDLYDTRFIGEGLGRYDIMSYPYGADNTGYIPASLSVWAKNEIEWQTCTIIEAEEGEYTLPPAATNDACYKIILQDYTTWEEAIYMENRQSLNWDVHEISAPGLMMYHVDDAADDQNYPGYPGLDAAWPETGDHYRIAVIQADGNYDLEQGVNTGDDGDVWKPGMILGPNEDGETFPNTDSYQQGYIEPTGITIEVLENAGDNVRFKVTRESVDAAFLTPVKDRGGTTNAKSHWGDVPAFSVEQFHTSDTGDRISGKIPHLPWYKTWKTEIQMDSLPTTSSTGGVGENPALLGMAMSSAVLMTATLLW